LSVLANGSQLINEYRHHINMLKFTTRNSLVICSDVMKLVKICIRQMQILTFKICWMWIEEFIL